jgi:nucleoside-diphosphate-sugar epimerase
MSSLVTGASGFIGSALVRRLSGSDLPSQVFALIRRATSSNGPPANSWNSGQVTVLTGDLTVPSSLKFKESNIKVIYHLAAASVTSETRWKRHVLRDINLDGTKNLFDAVRDQAKHFVYVSGLAVFEPAGAGGLDSVNEKSPKGREPEYIRIRLEAEEYLRENCAKSGIDLTVVYLPDIVYGNGGNFRRIFLDQIRSGRFRIPGTGEYYKNFIHLDDAVGILITLALKRNLTANESYIASDSGPAPFKEFVSFIADELGVRRPGSVPLFLAKAAVGSDLIKMLTKSSRASNEKISSLYEFQYPTFRTGLPPVVSQFKSCF